VLQLALGVLASAALQQRTQYAAAADEVAVEQVKCVKDAGEYSSSVQHMCSKPVVFCMLC
jgi:hypothetical protein